MRATGSRPRPVIDDDTRPFWDGTLRGLLLIQKCEDCGAHVFYPRALCNHCFGFNLSWTEASGFGTVYSFTISRRGAGPAFVDDVPYIVAIVELDEGPRMLTNILGCPPEKMAIGDRVSLDFVQVDSEYSLPVFRVVEPER